ncbi:hypothetical protein MKQ70_12765 [Chitinophaga sedimenti]|uniref:alpha-L-rhamnosidase C-terminal domain-containing protein n=1 Tax=Chitinophaga sedimenti TaxID=2033606 RepID=UPI002002EB2F|nr:alpha-L-rhamnosidase C-terminal domain-containing protein [Chitinophaga sedimenti]MCK7555839.1 hypothetical protein [Chitinophaga sedimenti]
MNSFNHYAYGAIGDWMYRVMVGIDTEDDAPGYRKITIKPHIGGGLTQAAASYQTNYGKLTSGWKILDGQLLMDVEIPANTTATVYVPGNATVTEGGKALSSDVQMIGVKDGYTVLKVGSGDYHFATAAK